MTAKLFPSGVPITKRLFDLILTIPGLLVISPILAVLALLVRLFHGSPIVFTQTRPGYRGQPFTMYKFRSMSNATGPDGHLLPDAERLTRFGHFLRASSLDELPELLNVLKGEMSLIGPRPLLMKYLDRYSPEQARRHNALPGITGWAQINGRNNVSWKIKFELDIWYVDNWSLWLDIQVLARTLWKVLAREGISEPGNATMHEFMGRAAEEESQS